MVIGCIGPQGTGKSQFCVDYKTKLNLPYYYFNNSNHKELYTVRSKKGYIYFIDDAQSYLSANVFHKLTKHILGLLSERRWMKTHFVFCFHTEAQIPSWLRDYFNRLVIFVNKDEDEINRIKDPKIKRALLGLKNSVNLHEYLIV